MENRPWQRHYDYNVPLTIRYPRVSAHYFLENVYPREIDEMLEFRDELPKSAVGKILRKVLRDEEAAKKK